MSYQKSGLAKTDRQRLLAKVDVRGPDECWPWTGLIGNHGYGRIHFEGHDEGVHRLSYMLEHNVRLTGKQNVHHNEDVCNNKLCCNPKHLEVMDHGKHSGLHSRLRTLEK